MLFIYFHVYSFARYHMNSIKEQNRPLLRLQARQQEQEQQQQQQQQVELREHQLNHQQNSQQVLSH